VHDHHGDVGVVLQTCQQCLALDKADAPDHLGGAVVDHPVMIVPPPTGGSGVGFILVG
jgi:hypothetical protein